MTPDATRRRAIGQILLLAAGFLVLVAISATSVLLVNKAREDNGLVVHTIEVENQTNAAAAGNPPRRKRRARLSADAGPELLRRPRSRRCRHPSRHRQARAVDRRTTRFRSKTSGNCGRRSRCGSASSPRRWTSSSRTSPPAPVALVREAAAGDTGNTIRDVAAAMRAEEERLFALRTIDADRTQRLASMVTIAGSGAGDRAGRHLDLPGAALGARARRGRSAAARQQPQSRGHRRRAHRRSARGQQRDPALRLHRQPRSALAAGQHHGLHQRTRGIARRYLQADRGAWPRRRAGLAAAGARQAKPNRCSTARTASSRRIFPRRSASSNRRSPRWTA